MRAIDGFCKINGATLSEDSTRCLSIDDSVFDPDVEIFVLAFLNLYSFLLFCALFLSSFVGSGQIDLFHEPRRCGMRLTSDAFTGLRHIKQRRSV